MSLRCIFIALGLGFLARTGSRIDGYSVATVILVGLAVDIRTPLTLRNFTLLYSIGLFYVGGRIIYPKVHTLSGDLLLYMTAFLVGYAFIKSRWKREAVTTPFDFPRPSKATLEVILRFLGGVEVVRWLLLVRPFGVRGFYSGQELTNRISSFGQTGNTTQAVTGIVLTALFSGTVALYWSVSTQTGERIRYWLLIVVLVLLPAISLQRSILVLQSLLLGGVYLCDKHFRAGPPSARSARILRRWLPVGVVLIVAVVVALKIGDIRAKQIDQSLLNQKANGSSVQQVLRGEFTPIKFYVDVKSNMGTVRYRYGEPIVTAFATRPVPRSIWPDKPITSQEIYMRTLQPVALARGFSLAPSLFGILYMNFGAAGTALCLVLLGGIAAYYDEALAGDLMARVPAFLIMLTWFYSLMRDDLATSAFSIVLTLVFYRFLCDHFRTPTSTVLTELP